MPREECPVCEHMEGHIVDRFLALPPGTPGKRGPRSLARAFGLDRRDIAMHERKCLMGGRTPRPAKGGDDAAA